MNSISTRTSPRRFFLSCHHLFQTAPGVPFCLLKKTLLASMESKESVNGDLREPESRNSDGHDSTTRPPALTRREQKQLWRKVDLRLMPTVAVMYLFSFMDRANIGNARLQGLVTQLDLTGNRYNIALTLYFVSFYVFAIPSNIVIKKFRPSRWLSGITMLWGLITTLMGLVKNYPQLVAVRVCLGLAESGLGCGVFYLFTLWYPRNMIQTRLGIFWGGATLAGAFSGLLAYGISFMSGTVGLLGWSWIFIIEGLCTVVVGFVSLFILVDLPETATFLTPNERAYLINLKEHDLTPVGEEEQFELRQLKDALIDWQVWFQGFLNLFVALAVYGITLFLPSIINGFGFNTTISQLLTVPPYVVGTVTVISWGIWSDRIQIRSPFVFAGLSLCLIGFAINISDASIGVKYFGTFLIVAGGYSSIPALLAWISSNVVGHYKRGVSISIQVIMSNIGGVIVSNIYRTQDTPRYILGHALELGFVALGIILVPITALVYRHFNQVRDQRQREAGEKAVAYSAAELRRLGDHAPDFRYTL
ncbi:MFS general substrate transporter [Lentinus tigrinus ALCF2SS1-6]|uniref:MFS general substrate transporter n=1 Tax=Lentinus tigrinus ALCF2SS1-6 TaxID=1328759 RepID=A0A5C2SB81_9APHY|nr:MFS general substrate transporter [Lentinus tigrinus ALCF2SS1-6]